MPVTDRRFIEGYPQVWLKREEEKTTVEPTLRIQPSTFGHQEQLSRSPTQSLTWSGDRCSWAHLDDAGKGQKIVESTLSPAQKTNKKGILGTGSTVIPTSSTAFSIGDGCPEDLLPPLSSLVFISYRNKTGRKSGGENPLLAVTTSSSTVALLL